MFSIAGFTSGMYLFRTETVPTLNNVQSKTSHIRDVAEKHSNKKQIREIRLLRMDNDSDTDNFSEGSSCYGDLDDEIDGFSDDDSCDVAQTIPGTITLGRGSQLSSPSNLKKDHHLQRFNGSDSVKPIIDGVHSKSERSVNQMVSLGYLTRKSSVPVLKLPPLQLESPKSISRSPRMPSPRRLSLDISDSNMQSSSSVSKSHRRSSSISSVNIDTDIDRASRFCPRDNSGVTALSSPVSLSKSWVPDTLVSHCYGCRIEFSFFRGRRKHHCRLCGNVFCHACTQCRIVVDKKPLRTCERCTLSITQSSYDESDFAMRYETTTERSDVSLLPNESVFEQIDDILFENVAGELVITNQHLILVENGHNPRFTNPIHIPILTIEKLEFSLDSGRDIGRIGVYCKNCRFVSLDISGLVRKQRFGEYHELENLLSSLVFPSTSHASPWGLLESTGILSPYKKEELSRDFSCCCEKQHYCHLEDLKCMIKHSNEWRISTVNESFGLCGTYPKHLAVPAQAQDAFLQDVATFRSRARLPVLSWIDPKSSRVICRCSQPHVGVFGDRSLEDESMIQLIAKAGNSDLLIVDARPQVNAAVNRLTRHGGYEEIEYYNQSPKNGGRKVSIEFMNVPKARVIRDSLDRVKSLIGKRLKSHNSRLMPSSVTGNDDFEDTCWHRHLATLLRATERTVRAMTLESKSVLVHCSDGWDRTSQIVSLAILCMDPEYRTLDGFVRLVEREWVSMGHQFRKRCGTATKCNPNVSESQVEVCRKDIAPIFLQFLEAIWQISLHHPCAFEFNETFLIRMADIVYEGIHSTFLVDSRKEQCEMNIHLRAPCAWETILNSRSLFLNPSFDVEGNTQVLSCLQSEEELQWWTGYFLRFDQTCSGESEKSQELL